MFIGFVAWKIAQRFPQLSSDIISGQGFAVVHATGCSRLFNQNFQAGEIAPFRRANASVVEWVEPHGCGERSSGPWRAHLDRPRNGAGVSET